MKRVMYVGSCVPQIYLLASFLTILCVNEQLVANELTVLTCFFAGQWKKGGFSTFENLLFKSEKLLKKYKQVRTIDIKLGSGAKEEEIRNGWTVLESIKKSLHENDELGKVVDSYQKKPEIAIIASSVSGLLMRAALQYYGDALPFICKHLITISSPHAGICKEPPIGVYANPVEGACADVQKFTTDSIMADQNSSPDNPAKPSWFTANAAAAFGCVFDVGAIAWKFLYNPVIQKNWISVWRDPCHLFAYRSSSDGIHPPFLPFFNNELLEPDAKKYANELFACQKKIALTSYFDFITADDDQFIAPETAHCKEMLPNKKNLFSESAVLFKRIGIKPDRAELHTILGAGHQCHTNVKIAQKSVTCLEKRW